MGAFAPGQHVQTPLGKGVILEVRNRRVLVRVQARDVLLSANDIRAIGTTVSTPRAAETSDPAAGGRAADNRWVYPGNFLLAPTRCCVVID